jgi:hypothetical protein
MITTLCPPMTTGTRFVVWISLLKNPGGKLEAKVQSQPVSEIFLCSVVKAELWHCIFHSNH